MTALVILLLVLVIGAFALIVAARARIEALEQRIAALEAARPISAIATVAPPTRDDAAPDPSVRADPPFPPAPAMAARVRHATLPGPPPAPGPAPDALPEPEPSATRPARFADFEGLVGGRLPIWVGGAALALAAFFLVRYSIEAGLLGPGVRVVLASLFGALLIAAGEAARRLRLTADDPRIAQSLTGAGVASLYGTLYMAGELYALVAPATAFALLVLVTALALALALRHGPPTAAMGLIGGFAAPLVSDVGARGLPGLLAYLTLVTAALFALSLRRGWGWLTIAATAAGGGWATWLLSAIDGPALGWLGPFVCLLAIGSALTLRRMPGSDRWQAVPLIAGLLLVALLGARLDHSPLGWAFHFLLVAASLWLATRDRTLIPAGWAALALTLVLLESGLEAGGSVGAGVAFALLGTAAGHWLLAREARLGAATALAAALGPALLARSLQPERFGDAGWAALLLASAGAAAVLAWRARDPASDRLAHVGGPAAAAILAGVAVLPAGQGWAGLALSGLIAALAAWSRRTASPPLAGLAPLAFLAALVAGVQAVLAYGWTFVSAAFGEELTYTTLPTLADGLGAIAAPCAALLTVDRLLPDRRSPAHRIAVPLAAIGLVFVAVHLLKLPLAIADPLRFQALGFAERAAITQALFAGAAAAWLGFGARRTALLLAGLALARFAWLDLLMVNPAWVPQRVGAIPVLNLAVLHAAATALWLWWLARRALAPAILRPAALVATAAAAIALVRQATHGTLMTGPVGATEGWLYSLALAVVALAWLARGIATGARDLRLASLALMVIVTLKVFLFDANVEGLGRVVSLIGLGIAAMLIGWAYGRVLRRPPAPAAADAPAADDGHASP